MRRWRNTGSPPRRLHSRGRRHTYVGGGHRYTTGGGYVSADKIFYFVINSAGAVALFVYAIIAGSQIRMRRKLEAESPERVKLRMWGYPWLSWLTLAGTLVVVVSMAFVDDARSQLLLSVISLAAILGIYLMLRRSAGSAHRTTHP
jgi:GABA permease